MSEKIMSCHTKRGACVYIRQSSMSQVLHHLEGQRRQYDLRERAQALGCQRLIVIDEISVVLERARLSILGSDDYLRQYAQAKSERSWHLKHPA